ncbi:MAG: hypothetical protein EXR05_07040 [Acetobacteraceae bacterium]|nr:hypothetical protein [Acetobacteraceae bacterium]MSP30668.1 hypothetical protein [Acetobacteraceae bacterium]
MLTWYLACRTSDTFAVYAPVAGAFSNPVPGGGAAPVKLLHTHGWRDETVLLEGHRIRDIAEQGDIFAGQTECESYVRHAAYGSN